MNKGDKKMEENKLIRFNIRLSKKVKMYFEAKSIETGVAQSALMALALEEYIDQKEMIKSTGQLNDYVKNLLVQK